jgi:hypothetical protein
MSSKRWPLIKWTMGFRPRQDQYETIQGMRDLNPNIPSWSELLRIGLDRVIAELRAVEQVGVGIYQGTTTAQRSEPPDTD